MLTGDVEAAWAAGAISRDHAQRLWTALPLACQALLDHGPHVVPALIPCLALLDRASGRCASRCSWLQQLSRPHRMQPDRRRGPGRDRPLPAGHQPAARPGQGPAPAAHPGRPAVGRRCLRRPALPPGTAPGGQPHPHRRRLPSRRGRPPPGQPPRPPHHTAPAAAGAGRVAAPVRRRLAGPGRRSRNRRSAISWIACWMPSPIAWERTFDQRFLPTPTATPCSPSSCCGPCRNGATWCRTRTEPGSRDRPWTGPRCRPGWRASSRPASGASTRDLHELSLVWPASRGRPSRPRSWPGLQGLSERQVLQLLSRELGGAPPPGARAVGLLVGQPLAVALPLRPRPVPAVSVQQPR